MTACADLRVLFRAPAGARRGFGHLVRCRSFARALGVRPLVAVRGSRRAVDAALLIGCDVVTGTASRLIRALEPDVLVVDDPIARDARAWMACARKAGCTVVGVHDLWLGCLESDLAIDGSVAPPRPRLGSTRAPRRLSGSLFAILDPDIAAQRRIAGCHRVLIALGGGPRVVMAAAIADAIAAAEPAAEIRIAAGFIAPAKEAGNGRRHGSPTWIGARAGLATELAKADVAVVGGGVSLYEAAALGVPAVGVPVVSAQRPTVSAFVARGAARRAGDGSPEAIAGEAVRLLRDAALRHRTSAAARRLVDGRGAHRAAAAVRVLVGERR